MNPQDALGERHWEGRDGRYHYKRCHCVIGNFEARTYAESLVCMCRRLEDDATLEQIGWEQRGLDFVRLHGGLLKACELLHMDFTGAFTGMMTDEREMMLRGLRLRLKRWYRPESAYDATVRALVEQTLAEREPVRETVSWTAAEDDCA